MSIALLVLNFNGRDQLAECLPSVLRAAGASEHFIEVSVIDTGSSDHSRDFVAQRFPEVRIIDQPNLGLTTYNGVLAELDCDIAILIRNDVKLAEDSIDALVAPLLFAASSENRCLLTTPQCRRFDGVNCDRTNTGISWRFGLVLPMSYGRTPNHEEQRAGWTGCAGPVVAVDRRKFLELGGFDPLYAPGPFEDLDFVFRGYLAGYHARYVPEAVAYRRSPEHASAAVQQDAEVVALRNRLLFHWKNLRHPWHVVRHAAGLMIRLAAEPLTSWRLPHRQRWPFVRAIAGALLRRRQMRRASGARVTLQRLTREYKYFRRFRLSTMGRVEKIAMANAAERLHKPSAVGARAVGPSRSCPSLGWGEALD